MCSVFHRPVEMPKGKRKKDLDMRTQISNSVDAGGSMRKFLILFTAGVLVSALAVADDDPPSRAARLSSAAGTGSFQTQGGGDGRVPRRCESRPDYGR